MDEEVPKCPKCNKVMDLIYVSKDDKSAFYKCPTEHGKGNSVYMVERR